MSRQKHLISSISSVVNIFPAGKVAFKHWGLNCLRHFTSHTTGFIKQEGCLCTNAYNYCLFGFVYNFLKMAKTVLNKEQYFLFLLISVVLMLFKYYTKLLQTSMAEWYRQSQISQHLYCMSKYWYLCHITTLISFHNTDILIDCPDLLVTPRDLITSLKAQFQNIMEIVLYWNTKMLCACILGDSKAGLDVSIPLVSR